MTWIDPDWADFLQRMMTVLGAVAAAAGWRLRRMKAQQEDRDHFMPSAVRFTSECYEWLDRLMASDSRVARVSIVEIHNGESGYGPGKRATITITTRNDSFASLHQRWEGVLMGRFYLNKIADTERFQTVAWDIRKHIEDAHVTGVLDAGRALLDEDQRASQPPSDVPQSDLLGVWEADAVEYALTHWIGAKNGRSFILASEWSDHPGDGPVPAEYRETKRRAVASIRSGLRFLTPYVKES